MDLSPENYPEIPTKDRPRPLFVNSAIPSSLKEDFAARGWEVQDVRLITNRADAVRAILEGIRVGTIEISKESVKFLELEARIEKLLVNKESTRAEEADGLGSDDVLDILSFGGPTTLPVRAPLSDKEVNKIRKARKTRVEESDDE